MHVLHCTMGTFQTTKQANFEIQFPEFSNSKWYKIEADIIEYEKGQEPSCDLIIGDKTMQELGIMLNWKENNIEMDKIILLMQNNKITHLLKLQLRLAVIFVAQQRHIAA